MDDSKDIRRELDFDSICDGNTAKLLTSHFQAIGVPKEYIFFPLLSTVSAVLGNSTIKINDEWVERCTLWTAVVARKGSRRSTVLSRFQRAIAEANGGDKIHTRCDVELNAEELNEDRVNLRLFEDLGSSKMMEPTMLKLAKAGYDNSSNQDRQSALNVFSFLPPDDALALLDDRNVDLNSRFLVACPKPAMFKSSDIRSPMPSNTPSLSKVLEVLFEVHSQPMAYSMTPQAKAMFDAYYDVVQDGLVRYDKDVRNFCILSKAAGQVARLGVVLSALRQALKAVVYRENVSPANWNVDVTADDIEAGKLIMDYAIDIRFTLLKRVSSARTHEMYPTSHRLTSPNMVPIPMNIHASCKALEPPVKRQRMKPSENEQNQMIASSSFSSQVVLSPSQCRSIAQAAESMQATEATDDQPKPSSSQPTMASYLNTSTLDGEQPNTSTNYFESPDPAARYLGYFASSNRTEQEEFYQPGRRNSTYVDCSTLTVADLPGYDQDQQVFIRRFGYKLKKLVEYRADCRISPSTCAQRHLMPPIPKTEMPKYYTQTRYPVSAAKEYLTKAAELGLGVIESTWHASNNRRSLIFQKIPADKLKPPAKNLLLKLQVVLEDYMASFNAPVEAFPGQDISMNLSAVDGDCRRLSPNVTSSSAARFPVPYPYLQKNTAVDAERVHTIMPESADSSESSVPNSEGSTQYGVFPKTEPFDDS